MDFFRQHKILYSIVSAVLVLSLVVYCFSFYSVQAAEISTLPADIDIIVSYDADNVSWSYSSTDYTFSRSYTYSYDCDGVTYYPRSSYPSSMQPPFNLYYTDCTYPAFTVETDRQNRLMGVSYWFSPSENALYILESVVPSDDSAYLSVRGFVKKDGYGCIVFDKWSSSKTYYNVCYRYDFISNSCTLGWVSTGSSNDSRFRTSYNYYDLSSGFTYYGKYNSQSEAYWVNSRNTTLTAYFPVDLLCLYSNYPISGFYEPDISKVETPDYYMTYQYIFYRKDKGYTFIDSARPLTEITAQGSYAYLTFAEVCNKYVYTSADGTAWTLHTDASSMYGSSFTRLAYDWLYDNVIVGSVNQYDAELVYTNDDKFGDKPLVTPDWGDITDITGNLDKFLDDYNIISSTGRGGTLNSFDYYCVEYPVDNSFFGSFMGTLTMSYVNYSVYELGYHTDGDFPQYIHVYFFGRDVPDSISVTLPRESSGNSYLDFATGLLPDSNAQYALNVTTKIPTLSMYLRLLNNSASNIDVTLSAFREDSYNALKGIFDNVTVTNTYLSTILDKLAKLNIPDYTASLKDISGKLDKLIPFDDSALLSYIGSFSTSIDTHFQSLQNHLDNRFSIQGGKLDSILSAIPSGSGSVSVDFTELTKSVTDMSESLNKQLKDGFDDIHGDLKYIKTLLTVNTIDNLFDDENDDDTGIIKYLRNVITTLQSGAIISDSLTVGGDTMSGVKLLNGYVQDIYTRFPVLAPLVLFPPAVALANTIMRKGRA